MRRWLTDAMVKNLAADPNQRQEVQDAVMAGLRLRVSPSGIKSWSVMLRVAGERADGARGKNRRISLGKYPLVSLKEAREKAQVAIGQADRGANPAAKKAADIQARVNRSTRLVFEQYIDKHARPNTVKWKEAEALLKRTVVSEWEEIDLATIRRADVHDLLDGLVRSDGKPIAREVRKHLSAFMNWAVDRGYLDASPMAGMRRPDLQYTARDRVLSLEELASIWRAAESVDYPFGPMVQLLILTGQRRGEIGELRRGYLKEDTVELPAVAYKTGINHIVPLTMSALNVLESLPTWNAGDYVFSTTGGRTPSSGYSRAKTRFDKLVGFDDWTFHDIRRSVASHMASLGVIQEHIERVLGHKIPGIAGVYNKHSYLPEKKVALQLWEKALMEHLLGNE